MKEIIEVDALEVSFKTVLIVFDEVPIRKHNWKRNDQFAQQRTW